MPATLIDNINLLVNATENFSLLKGKDLSVLPCIENAYLIIEGDQIAGYGSMKNLNHKAEDFAFHINATGKIVLPSWCDSHTHLVFAANREGEFINRIRGLSYEEIALKGGGILHSAKQLNETSEDKLFTQAYDRLQDVMKLGTGAIEIKSGYGLTVEGELKMLRVISRLKNSVGIPIKATFLGAHSFPLLYKEDREGYIKLIIEEMLPAIAKDSLADYIDVFCEEGFYTPGETERICIAGLQNGLKSKIHANQLHVSGGGTGGCKSKCCFCRSFGKHG
jgi:imidazolonepropionase